MPEISFLTSKNSIQWLSEQLILIIYSCIVLFMQWTYSKCLLCWRFKLATKDLAMSLNRYGHCSPTYLQERETVIKQYKMDKNCAFDYCYEERCMDNENK